MPIMHASAVAGACAGLVSAVVTCPLDVVKTKLQAQGSAAAGETRYDGLNGTLRQIWKDDGLRGFYRGLGPTIFGYLPTWAIYFTVYDTCKQTLARDLNSNGEEGFLNHILSAMTAGASSTICTSPLWVVKTRFMLQSHRDVSTRPYRHTGDAFLQIYRTEGLRGFYKGLLPSLFGVSHVAVQFPLYESFKAYARSHSTDDDLQPGTILACSSTAKMIASVMTYPHEVLRTRLQMQPRPAVHVAQSSLPAFHTPEVPQHTPASSQHHRSLHTAAGLRSAAIAARGRDSRDRQGGSKGLGRRKISNMGNTGGRYSGVIQACKTIAKEEGFRGFYKGMGVNLIRTVPSSALTILTYEVIMHHLVQPNADLYDGQTLQSEFQSDEQHVADLGGNNNNQSR